MTTEYKSQRLRKRFLRSGNVSPSCSGPRHLLTSSAGAAGAAGAEPLAGRTEPTAAEILESLGGAGSQRMARFFFWQAMHFL